MDRVLSDADVADLLDVEALLPVIEGAFRAQGRGAVERPERPHFPVGVGIDGRDEPAGTGLTMSAYVHGADHYATKIVGVHEGNAARGLETVNALVVMTDAATGLPRAVMAGNRITNARTGCIGGLAARELASAPVTLAIIGAGTQARWQARAIATATDVREIRVYSPSDSRERCADELGAELDLPVEAVGSSRTAVDGATVVVTATTATEPVFAGDALAPGALVVAVGAYTSEMRELDATTIERAARVFADVPVEVAPIGDVAPTDLDASDLVPFATLFEDGAARQSADEILVVESVGSAVLDAATGEHLLDAAVAESVGTTVSFE